MKLHYYFKLTCRENFILSPIRCEFPPGFVASSTIKPDCRDMTEMLLKAALNPNQTKTICLVNHYTVKPALMTTCTKQKSVLCDLDILSHCSKNHYTCI